VAIVKADTRYDSAVVDPYGRIRRRRGRSRRPPSGRRGRDVALGSGKRTFWNRYATQLDVVWIVAGAAVAALVLRDLRRERRAPTGTAQLASLPAGRGRLS
jgi:hypothetical protein